jgi:hypothetical protein
MPNQILENITNNRLFKDIKVDELIFNSDPEKLIYKQAGDIIYSEGDSAEDIFLIFNGEVRIIKERLLGVAKKVILKPGDFFGEEDFLENMPHTTIAYANTDCRLFVLNRTEIDALRKKDITIFKNLRRASKERETEEKSKIVSEDLNIEMKNTEPFKENLKQVEVLPEPEFKEVFIEPKQELKNSILKEIKSLLGNVKLLDVVNSVRDSIKRLTNAEETLIYLFDKENDEIKTKISDGNNFTEIRLKKGQGIAGLVTETKEVINIKNVQGDKRFTPYYDGIGNLQITNLLCSPIINKADEVIGVFYLVNCNNGEFVKSDEELLNEFSPYVIQILEVANVFENFLYEEKKLLLTKMSNFINREIKKPVLVSKRFAEHLKYKNLSSEINQTIDMQLEQLNYISDLIQSTSNYCEGKSNLQLAKCKLNDSLNEILDKLDSTVTIRNSHIERKFDREVMVNLDKKEFYFVCFHILRNACDAMPNGGKILITTATNINDVTITIKDSGQGIAIEIFDRIFDPFVSYGKKDSTGLGLAIVKNIIKNHNGKISVESNPGDGAAFIIVLPIM